MYRVPGSSVVSAFFFLGADLMDDALLFVLDLLDSLMDGSFFFTRPFDFIFALFLFDFVVDIDLDLFWASDLFVVFALLLLTRFDFLLLSKPSLVAAARIAWFLLPLSI